MCSPTCSDLDFGFISEYEYKFPFCKMNLVLIGGPKENRATALLWQSSATARLRQLLSFGPEDGSVSFRGKTYLAGAGVGILLWAPLEDVEHERSAGTNSLDVPKLLLICGTDPSGLRAAVELGQPTIPPMMRAPFTNQIPDFLVVHARELKTKGAGGILQAGFWERPDAFVREATVDVAEY